METMLKVITLLTRREGMEVVEFQRLLREAHAPLTARTPGLRRYIQSHALPETYEGNNPPAYDALNETWFDDLASYETAGESPEWQAALTDLDGFTAGREVLSTTEVAIVDDFPAAEDRAHMVKYLSFLTRKDGMSVGDFQKHWREVHAPLIVAELTRMRRYVQCHPLPESYGWEEPPPFDGIPQAWYDNLEAGRPTRTPRPDGEPPPPSPMIADAANFMKPGRLPSMIAREVVIIG